MELLINNVGKIDNARIEFNGLTVITGYNGTGKSTLCRALYSIMDTFSDVNQKILTQRKNSMINYIYNNWQENLLDDGLDEDESEKIVDILIQHIISMKSFDDNSHVNKVFDEITQEFRREISTVAYENFLDKYMEIAEKDKDDYMDFIISRNVKAIFRNQIGHVNFSDKESVIKLIDEQKVWEMVFCGNDLITYDYRYSTLKKPIYIEPQSVLDNFEAINSRFLRKNTNGIQSFLVNNEMHSSKITLEEYQELQQNLKIINDILQEVTRGRLVSNKNYVLSYSEKGLDEEIACSNIASGLKPFLIIQRMIENGALGQGRFLIIDEPEVNLHPEWQIAFAKILVLLNKELNIRVILSTHSPYFLRAIEYYMREFENEENGKFYLTTKSHGIFYTVEDVTENLECVYKAMYTPLEEIN